ncbi:unnamed protein product [Pedinophyceae sp. YPF-701]|nr:unnamed protein product [Pedinophyceae sp. YPF-701]
MRSVFGTQPCVRPVAVKCRRGQTVRAHAHPASRAARFVSRPAPCVVRDGPRSARIVANAEASHGEAANGHDNIKWEATPRVLRMWRSAHAVCFDVDMTLTTKDGIDALAEFKGVGQAVADITNSAMDGVMDLEESLQARMQIINPSPDDIARYNKQVDPRERVVPGAKELIESLQARGIAVFLISGGFRELLMPIARYLGVKPSNIYANRMFFVADDETGLPTKFAGFDPTQPTSRQMGKPAAIADIRNRLPYETIVMVGDGITDLEAVEVSGGADLFVGFGGVVQRDAVAKGADWYIKSYDMLVNALERRKLAFIGSGAWACASMMMAASNLRRLSKDAGSLYAEEVTVWVHDEDWNGESLAAVIARENENPKYFPGHKLGPNVRPVTDIAEAVDGATMVAFCAPHQFIVDICRKIDASGKLRPDAIGISLIKGMRVRAEGPQLISEMIRKVLNIDVSVMMGANIAGEIASGYPTECTLGFRDRRNAEAWQKVFDSAKFEVQLNPDIEGTEMCGTLKNVVALGVGMVEGLGAGQNARAVVLRRGLYEMRAFAQAMFPSVQNETFFMSCGVADLVASSYGGRNSAVGREFARAWAEDGEKPSFDDLERDLLKGQKLQGVLTVEEIVEVMGQRGIEKDYPLFMTIHAICKGEEAPYAIFEYREVGRQAAQRMRSRLNAKGPTEGHTVVPKTVDVEGVTSGVILETVDSDAEVSRPSQLQA